MKDAGGQAFPIKITMMELRREPGEWIHHQVWKHGQTILITHCGKNIAIISSIQDTIIDSKGRIHGKTPLTYKRPELLK